MLTSLQVMIAGISCLAAVYAARSSRLASDASSGLKRLREVERQISDLQSNFDSLMESHKRLRSRVGMRQLRDEKEIPIRETKAQARARVFGSAAGPAFAEKQLRIAGDE